MNEVSPILLFVGDGAVLSSLEFALTLESLSVANGAAGTTDPSQASCLVVDQRYCGDGLAFLAGLRRQGVTAAAVLLVTNPTPVTRERAAAAGAALVEKPLLGEELTDALREALEGCRAIRA